MEHYLILLYQKLFFYYSFSEKRLLYRVGRVRITWEWGGGFSSNFEKLGGQNKMTLWDLGNLALKWEGKTNLFFTLSVILTGLVDLIIWSAFDTVLKVYFFRNFYYVPRTSVFTLLLKKKVFFFALCQ